MAKAKLEKDQAGAVRQDLQPSLGYLYRLKERMTQVGFLTDDPLYQLVDKAYDRLHKLCVELHYLSCDGGVGRKEEDNQAHS
jgi:hypothetical protein